MASDLLSVALSVIFPPITTFELPQTHLIGKGCIDEFVYQGIFHGWFILGANLRIDDASISKKAILAHGT
ncbi:MAG: hypothetical protein R2911_45355 [Caldilineaceae bacterium]